MAGSGGDSSEEGCLELSDLENVLVGVPYTGEAMSAVLERMPLERIFGGCDTVKLRKFLLPEQL